MEKILTIIIPAYNTEDCIERCLDSIQSDKVNVVIVDDGSVDRTGIILDEYCQRHDNFKVIHTENRGAAAARREGLKYVNTKYFSYVDSDDMIRSKEYMNLISKMEENDLKIGYGRVAAYLPNNPIPFPSRPWKKNIIDFSKDKKEFSNVNGAFWDKIFHQDCIPYFDQTSKQVVYEDSEFTYFALANEQKIYHTNDLIYKYCLRTKDKSTSALNLDATKKDGIAGVLAAGESMINRFKEGNLYQEYQEEISAIILKMINWRVADIYFSNQILNKEEIINIVFDILDAYMPGWQNNKYYLEYFRGSEFTEQFYAWVTRLAMLQYRKDIHKVSKDNYQSLLYEYGNRLVLKDKTVQSIREHILT